MTDKKKVDFGQDSSSLVQSLVVFERKKATFLFIYKSFVMKIKNQVLCESTQVNPRQKNIIIF